MCRAAPVAAMFSPMTLAYLVGISALRFADLRKRTQLPSWRPAIVDWNHLLQSDATRARYSLTMSRNIFCSRRNPVCTPSHLEHSKECISAPKARRRDRERHRKHDRQDNSTHHNSDLIAQ